MRNLSTSSTSNATWDYDPAGFFIIMTVLAFVIYPRRPAVYRPQSFVVQIQTDIEVTNVQIAVAKLSSNRFSLEIDTTTDTPNPLGLGGLTISLQLPVPVTPGSCEVSCFSKVVSNGSFAGEVDYVHYLVSDFEEEPGTSLWLSRTILTVDAPVFAFNENGLDVEAQLPAVQLLTIAGDPNIEIFYYLHDAADDWAGGPSPTISPASRRRTGEQSFGICLSKNSRTQPQ